ncbi:MAG: hypothetical protein JWP94_2945 [Mucilaginibacter sp.]|nr:hypothetical protein [Mucilaginibacter sp.]
MKRLNRCLYLIMFVCVGCKSGPVQFDQSLTILWDKTGRLQLYPKAENISPELNLKENIWQGVSIIITSISDQDVNDRKFVTLPAENQWVGTEAIRLAKINHFNRDLQNALADSIASPLGHSIVYRTILKELSTLANSQSKNRYIAIYSDMMEHSDVDFYNAETFQLLRANPDRIKKELERSGQLPSLSGIQVWLIYNPRTYDANNSYMVVARFYKQLLESHGAIVHIEHSFTLGR